MEAEYVACTSAVQEAIWLRRFLKSLHILHVDDAVVIYCDNTAAIAYAKDPKYHGRTKHIDTRYHFIRDSIAQGEVVLRHIPTNDMIADPFTKPLHRDAFHRHAPIDPLTRAITLALMIMSGMRVKRSFGINELCDSSPSHLRSGEE
ncbi:UNVERIFIED_CONTAM: Copia protein [Sesamum radiatum]|uniref:Copia protein n=1 Tax=Sesamum radiatum TaxID=300843 RepID=A0AAW2JXR4_SESRA